MSTRADAPLDELWNEYSQVFRDFDDLTLARWMAQTLGQLKGRSWRLSHPLVAAYRLAAHHAEDRQIWLKRLATAPQGYTEAACCRAPFLPLLTRDVRETGLSCLHCGETLVPFEEMAAAVQKELGEWAGEYGKLHSVAHWTEAQQVECGDYDGAFDHAAEQAEELLGHLGAVLAPKLLEDYPAVVWEDQDECLEVRPEDVSL